MIYKSWEPILQGSGVQNLQGFQMMILAGRLSHELLAMGGTAYLPMFTASLSQM